MNLFNSSIVSYTGQGEACQFVYDVFFPAEMLVQIYGFSLTVAEFTRAFQEPEKSGEDPKYREKNS